MSKMPLLGRVNKLAANLGAYVATSFKDTANMPAAAAQKIAPHR